LWYSRAAGILAAFFVAFSGPLIAVTLGREYLHAPYAILLISCHLALFVAYLGRPSMPVLIVSPLLALVLAAVWRTADLYLAFFAVLLLLCSGKDTRERRKLMVGHLVAMIVAGVILPHLTAERFLLGWPLLLVLTSTVYLFVKGSLPSKVPAAGWALSPMSSTGSIGFAFCPASLMILLPYPIQRGFSGLKHTLIHC
jgi:hypothetical protein